MKKLLLVAGLAALWIAPPASASSGSFRGVVIAKQPSRHALVVARASGAVSTLHVPGAAVVGSVVVASGTQIRVVGRTDRARFRGVVVRNTGPVTFFAAGQSVVAARSSAKVRGSAAQRRWRWSRPAKRQ